MDARFLSGNPEFVQFKRGTAIAAGEVIITGAVVGIAHNNFAANENANLSVGPGVYESTATGILAPGVDVDWDDSANELVATTTGDAPVGSNNLTTASVAGQLTEFIFNGRG